MLKNPPPDWWPPDITVFVAGSPRSGSTLLCKSMERTGILGRPDEFFSPAVMRGRVGEADIDLERCFFLARERGMTGNRVLGSKLFWDHLCALHRSFAFDLWFPNRSWVFLNRRDVLGQAISWVIGAQTRRWTMWNKPAGVPEYSRHLIVEQMQEIMAAKQSWERYFAERQISPLMLSYEDIENDMHEAIVSIARHVGGKSLETRLLRTEPFLRGTFGEPVQKQRTLLNDQWRGRFLSNT
jgi:LPS sulfotransferase NodH